MARARVFLVLALILAAGCTTKTTFWGDPDRSPPTKADMNASSNRRRVKGRASRQNVEGAARRKTGPAPPVPKPARPPRRPGPPRLAPPKPR